MSSSEIDKNLRIYLNEIAQTPLLTPEEEIELANRIHDGDEKAREHMIKANLRLVVKIAQDYSGYGVALADLISEGNIGLTKAVERFDPTRGAKLSSYAAWWIKQSIKRALANQGKTVRLPVHMVQKIARMRRIERMMAEVLGRQPTDEELSEETGIPRRKLSALRRASQRTTSLDAPINEGEAATYSDTIGDENAASPLDVLSLKNSADQLGELLELLDDRESRIIDARFGLNGKKPMNLEEIGRDFGLTRERIRQLQNKALEKMRFALHRKDNPLPRVTEA
ncbi:sigma-70 family RNA polymerase sigma factor [Haloferula rosea]|uniref:RNA polymerase sigma factor RpoD/SigA n=1 Tax=Haloferula rosea TaxID=490093 RepID=A0A934RBW9_9BACT|nr:RNA polymerase sigma factor RpoD/SigA [Haloferula rosea]MBK1826918.1 RNA polymerase sigma factor RpoD/SigA [Haloferula rosea]